MESLLRWGVKLWTAFGIEVRLHLVFILWVSFDLLGIAVQHGVSALPSAAVFSGMLFLIVLLHEYGHCFAGRMVGGTADRILMWPLGGLAFVSAPYQPTPQLIVAVGGPLVNVAFILLLTPYVAFGPGVFSSYILRFYGDTWDLPLLHRYLSIFYAINIDLLYFNLIPAFPMDGGRILRSLLWYRLGLTRSTLICVTVAKGTAIVMVLAGLVVLAQGGAGLLLAAIGVFVWFGAEQERRMVQAGGGIGGEQGFYVPEYRPERRSWWKRRRDRIGRRREEKADERRAQRDQKVDALLEKVHRDGITSLSTREKKFLNQASRHYKR